VALFDRGGKEVWERHLKSMVSQARGLRMQPGIFFPAQYARMACACCWPILPCTSRSDAKQRAHMRVQ
jgi:hypothetical protein